MSNDGFDKLNEGRETEKSSARQSSAFSSDLQEETFDYNSIYGIEEDKEASDRERKRRGDAIMLEIRREAEMKAIREDIERRYSMELEAAQSKEIVVSVADTEAQTVLSVEDEAEKAVVADDTAKTQEIKAPGKKQKHARERGGAYEMVYSFGDDILKSISVIFMLIFRLIATPIKAIYGYSEKATGYAAKRAKRYAAGFILEMRHFRKEIRSTSSNLRRAFKHPSAMPAVLWYYFKKAYKRHRNLLRTLFNTAMPIAALLIFAITFNYWSGVTFALNVKYNDKNIGYISSEAVYIEAQELIKKKMDSGAFAAVPASTESAVLTTAAAEPDFQADYSLTLVSLEELNDAQTICDKVIENSADNLTNACGVYIGDTFLCAVKNEADAKTVFNKIIEPYEFEAKAKGYVVGFAENIDYVQGLYPDDSSVMWDAVKLETELTNGTHEVTTQYTISRNDTAQDIAAAYSISVEKLQELNPGYDFDNPRADDKITISSMEKYIYIKKTVTSTINETVKYSTVISRDATKYSGYRSVTQKGVNGVDKVTTISVYIDDELDENLCDTKRDHIVKPIEEKVVVGTNTYYSGIYVGTQSSKGFLWPAPSCHSVSSPYGYRSSGWHKGIDLIKSGGGASGTPVIASRSGRVEVVSYGSSSYGNMILINHGDGYKTRYAHLRDGSIRVSEGDYVEAGEQIGRVGSTGNSTGPHLHFEVIYNGSTQNPKKYI